MVPKIDKTFYAFCYEKYVFGDMSTFLPFPTNLESFSKKIQVMKPIYLKVLFEKSVQGHSNCLGDSEQDSVSSKVAKPADLVPWVYGHVRKCGIVMLNNIKEQQKASWERDHGKYIKSV